MKNFIPMLLILVIVAGIPYTGKSQIIDPKETTKQKGEDKANQKIDGTIDKGLNKIEDGIGGLFKKKKKKGKKKADKDNTAVNPDEETSTLNWAKFDFVSGNKVIFEDNLLDEENGEFPSRWDLVEGRAENASLDNKNVIYLMSPDTRIIPYLENPETDYLPDVFTLEFDAWFEKEEYPEFYVWFFDENNQEAFEIDPLVIFGNMASLRLKNNFTGFYPGKTEEYNEEESFWRHISIAFNKRSLKVYLDDARVLNIPNLGINPSGITLGADPMNVAGIQGVNRFIKNIRIAEGGTKLYDKFLQEGKIIASGIRFDTNKATLKPESMGIINSIKKIMTDHPEICFSVEGHTDSDGDLDFNQKLSEQRAAAVTEKLISMGIASSRLTSKGFGESLPIATNETPDGKAMNRRVEFVKQQL